MRLLHSLTVLVLVGSALPTFAEDIPYVDVQLCDLGPYKSARDYWDQTGTFCFVRDNQVQKYAISDLGEVKLRDKGKTLFGPYYDALSDEDRQIVNEYHTYYVRYLALGEAKAGEAQPFVTHVFYSWGGSTQTIWAFGELSATGDVRFTGFSNSGAPEAFYRNVYGTLRSVFSLFRGRNPVTVGRERERAEDRRRIQPAGRIVKEHHGKGKTLPVPEVLKP